MNELHLFAGAGGGILAGQLLGRRCVCAVEFDPYAQPSLSLDRTTAPFLRSRFGMTFEPLMDDAGEELLMWWLAGFHVRTSVRQGPVSASTESEAACGSKWRASFAKYDLSESKWRTPQCSLLGDSDEFSETWPRWGSMRNGVSYLRPIPALPIYGNAFGLWPTPTVHGNHNMPGASTTSGWGLSSAVKRWQTPVADDAIERKAGKWNSRGEPKLSAEVKLFPTPCAIDAGSGRMNKSLSEGASERPTLAMMARKGMWPTPSASASKGSSQAALVRKDGKSRERDRIDHAVMASDGGQLNPEWVEWLMGWPIGHTALKPLAMDKYHEWLQQHGICSQREEAA